MSVPRARDAGRSRDARTLSAVRKEQNHEGEKDPWAIAGAATAILLLSACGDGGDSSTTAAGSSTSTSGAAGATTIAKGEDVELVGGEHSGLGNQTLNINAEEVNGKATGDSGHRQRDQGRLRGHRHRRPRHLGGKATRGPDFAAGDLVALIIREGDPDSVDLRGNDTGAATCTGLLKSIPDDLLNNESNFVAVEDGYDIEPADRLPSGDVHRAERPESPCAVPRMFG